MEPRFELEIILPKRLGGEVLSQTNVPVNHSFKIAEVTTTIGFHGKYDPRTEQLTVEASYWGVELNKNDVGTWAIPRNNTGQKGLYRLLAENIGACWKHIED